MRRLIVALLVVLLEAKSSYAYLDPGTGSMLLQGLLAGIALVAAGVAGFWTRIVQLFKGRQGSAPPGEGDVPGARLP